MGLCPCLPSGSSPQNSAISRQLKKDAKVFNTKVKVLLLGPGESGKSTIFKQMKVIHCQGYTDEERLSFIPIIHGNCIKNMCLLLDAILDLDIGYDTFAKDAPPSLAKLRKSTSMGSVGEGDVIYGHFRRTSLGFTVVDMEPEMQAPAHVESHAGRSKVRRNSEMNPSDPPDDILISPSLAAAITDLWNHPNIQSAYAQRSRFQLGDNTAFFINSLDRITLPGYVPTTVDILNARVRTSGVVTMDFTVDDVDFQLHDAGGQRSERRKWLHFFDKVDSVLFVASIAEYDQVLFEDDSQNRMQESLNVFAEVCNNRHFEKTAIILFLNKYDLFEQKLAVKPLKTYFPSFDGGDDVLAAAKFLAEIFLELNKTDRGVFLHLTTATDTGNVKKVFDDTKEAIIEANLVRNGFV